MFYNSKYNIIENILPAGVDVCADRNEMKLHVHIIYTIYIYLYAIKYYRELRKQQNTESINNIKAINNHHSQQ